MGRKYELEMQVLPQTYDWAGQQDVSGLSAFLAGNSEPLIAVGSGGSLSSAHLTQTLHQRLLGRVAVAMTPLEIVRSGLNLAACNVVFFTAGGRNADILGAFDHVSRSDPKSFAVVCCSIDSPIARRARGLSRTQVFEFAPPVGHDGFLATNSLLATSVALLRAYNSIALPKFRLPRHLRLLRTSPTFAQLAEPDNPITESLWHKHTLVVLYPPLLKSVAIDLESKFTEAALGNVSLCDYRHFAHGRHHWIAKHLDNTAVIALTTHENDEIERRTLELLPKNLKVLRITASRSDSIACLSMLIACFHLVQSAGRAKGINPGKPGVPKFGRELYHLRAFKPRGDQNRKALCDSTLAIQRKQSGCGTNSPVQHSHWTKAYLAFIEKLQSTDFVGIVCDYDGTLCDENHRLDPLNPSVVAQLKRLLGTGALIGIATGRGKSVRKELRAAIPKRHWDRTIVGYYNGGQVGTLSDDDVPTAEGDTDPSLLPTLQLLSSDKTVAAIADLEVRPNQLTLSPKSCTTVDELWRQVSSKVQTRIKAGVTVLMSGHSVDILADGVSKLAVVQHIIKLANPPRRTNLLCIGDQGRWPGNDFALLNTPFSLSVQNVSQCPATCWNLSPSGLSGVPATLAYLERLIQASSAFRFDVS